MIQMTERLLTKDALLFLGVNLSFELEEIKPEQ